MHGIIAIEDLALLNPEIEATYRHNNLREKEESKKYKGVVNPHLHSLHKATIKWKRSMHDE